MKKLFKILLATITGSVLLLSAILGAGCNAGGAGFTFKDYNVIVKSAATDFYSAHTEYETFQDITYRWTEHEVNKENFTLEYKENATDEDPVSETFADKTVTDATYTVAVKKGDGKLIAQFTVTRTTAVDSYGLKVDDTLDHIVSTTVASETFRLVTVADAVPAYYLIYESSTKTDNENAVVVKKYKNLTQEDYDNYMDYYMVRYPNIKTNNTFFSFGEIFMVYSSFMTVEKKDNRVSLSFGYEEMPQINVGTASYDVAIISMLQKIIFENGKILKAEISSKQSSNDSEFEKSVVFDFLNSATVDVDVDFTDFTEDTSWSFTSSFTNAISDLPDGGIFS